jgi:hypothetical protein
VDAIKMSASPSGEGPEGDESPEQMNGSPVELEDAADDSSSQQLIAAMERLTLAVDTLCETIRTQPSGSPRAPVEAKTATRPAAATAVMEAPGDSIMCPPGAHNQRLTDADEWVLDQMTKNPHSKGARLFRGDWQGLGYKQRGHAEMALLAKLAWTTKGDEGQMSRIFRASQLVSPRFDREGAEMIERAIEFVRDRDPDRFEDV